MEIIDIHSHLLPGVDDSKLSRWHVKKMMNIYKEARIGSIVFTPHINDPYVKTKRDKIMPMFEKVSRICSDMGIRTYLGSEYYIRDDSKALDYIALQGKYVLCETDVNFAPQCYLETLQKIKDDGKQIILAHVERYKWLTPESPLFRTLTEELGALVQVNVKGIKTEIGRKYLRLGLVDFLATDNHGDFEVPFGLYEISGQFPDVARKMNAFVQNL